MTRPQLALILGSLLAVSAFSRADDAIHFNRDIRPILSDNCFLCHGPDKNNRKAKLRLDDPEAALAKKAIIPGDASNSEAIKRIFTNDEDDIMPPPDSNRTLTATQKALLKKWVEQGAKYEPHWAYMLVTRPAVPAVKEKDWVANAIDAFILQALEAKKIRPSEQADRATLLRRLSLDLIGLPPTPVEVEAFEKDQSPQAYEKQVDRLLASPHFGERMAVLWLDLARFADTVGYHGDQNQRIFPYRDWVINAFNQNKKFDQFTIEQLAGDLLPDATIDQQVATGFNRLNMMTREGGAQPKEYLAKYTADRVRTVSTAFLGSTMACSECHDHKYDPFTARDFYSLGAYFADVKQWGVYMNYNYTPNPDLVGFSNEHPFPPEIQVDSPYLKQRQTRIRSKMNALLAQTAGKLSESQPAHAREEWLTAAREFLKRSPQGWFTPAAVPVASKLVGSAQGAVQPDGSILYTGKARKGDEQQITVALPAGWVSAIRLELIPHARHKNGQSRDGGKGVAVQLAATHRNKSNIQTRLGIYAADADLKETRYKNGAELIGIRDAWRTSLAQDNLTQTGIYLLDKPFKAAAGDTLLIALKSDNLGCVRISVSCFADQNPLAIDGRAQLAALDDGAAADRLYFLSTGWEQAAFAQYRSLHAELLETHDGKAWTMVTQSVQPTTQRVLPRGNWQDDSGDIVTPATPAFLTTPATRNKQSATRLELARWLVSKDNPLTARTWVNRQWKQLFGNGLSAVVDDLGAQGEPPTHPQLLDWLSAQFQETWDMKQIVKLMVMSSTYRQSARLRPELRDIDPNNRLLASQNPRRLEAEIVRDNALFISGLINLDIGGPSAHPYQPAGYYANIQFPNRDYFPDSDERQYRRGLYTHWQRTFMHPMLANFDAPSREECTAFRNVTNTPQQALTLLNDPSFVEAARAFAARLLSVPDKGDAERLEQAYQQALLRPIKENERASLLKFLAAQRAYFTEHPDDAKKLTSIGLAARPQVDQGELAAWSTVCRVILNLHETITRY